MKRIALTGGMGSGKSHVRAVFAALGVPTIDADTLARDVVAHGTPGFEAVVTTFGRGILTADGDLDRRALAGLVFADIEKRRALEAILHPAIKGAIDHAQLGNLTGLLAKIAPAGQATTYSGERVASNYAFVDAVARKNVELTLAKIRKDSPVLAELAANGTIKMTGAMYNIGTGAVEFFA